MFFSEILSRYIKSSYNVLKKRKELITQLQLLYMKLFSRFLECLSGVVQHLIKFWNVLDLSKINFQLLLKNILIACFFSTFFRWLENHQVNLGMLSENDFVVDRRKYVCRKLLDLKKAGYYLAFLDET